MDIFNNRGITLVWVLPKPAIGEVLCGVLNKVLNRVEERDAHLAALKVAGIGLDIASFARFVAERVQWSLEQAA